MVFISRSIRAKYNSFVVENLVLKALRISNPYALRMFVVLTNQYNIKSFFHLDIPEWKNVSYWV